MSWVKLDDRFPENLKVVSLSDRAFRVHVEALCYCARNLTDGLIPKAVAEKWSRKHVGELVDADLWATVPSGFEVNDYLDYNPSRAAVEEQRQKRSEAGRRGGERSGRARRGEANAEANASANAQANDEANAQAPGFAQNRTPSPTPTPTRSSNPDGLKVDGWREVLRRYLSNLSSESSVWKDVPEDDLLAAASDYGFTESEAARYLGDVLAWWRDQPRSKLPKKSAVRFWRNWLKREHERTRPADEVDPEEERRVQQQELIRVEACALLRPVLGDKANAVVDALIARFPMSPATFLETMALSDRERVTNPGGR